MKPNYNSEVQQSYRLGHGQAFISQIRQNNNDKYCYIKALSSTQYFEDGYHKYRQLRDEVYNRFLKLLNYLIDRRWVSAFERDIECTKYRMQHIGLRIQSVYSITWRIFRELEVTIPKLEAFIERRTRHERTT